MKTADPIRGYEKIHTVACYKDTWVKFQNMKKKHHLTADQALNTLINNYTHSGEKFEKLMLIQLDKDIQKKIKKL